MTNSRVHRSTEDTNEVISRIIQRSTVIQVRGTEITDMDSTNDTGLLDRHYKTRVYRSVISIHYRY